MRAEIITSGTELLLGDTLDTNAAYLSQQLRALGIDIHYRTTVGDNEERTANAISIALSRADLVITTGGLGPTVDDVTRQAVARATGRPLRLHADSVTAIEARFRSFGSTMTENNLQQAYMPEGAIVIENPVGTAPSFIVETPQGTVISLPGVPRELEYLTTHAVIPYLREHLGLHEVIKSRVLKTCAIGESAIDAKIGDLMTGSNPTVGLSAHPGQTDVRITAKAVTEEEADRLIAGMEAKIRERLAEYIYGAGNQTLEEVVLTMLVERGETLAVLETTSSGQLCQRLANAPGSAPFLGGLVLASREALLACIPSLEAHLSSEDWAGEDTAQAVASALRERFATSYGLALLADRSATEVPPRTAIALVGPEGAERRAVRRSARDGHGRTWLATIALDTLRGRLLSSKP